MRHFFTYNGKRSSDFGVFISGTETFGAPERDVERVTIPGKNGDELLDNGRYRNIRQTYPAFIPKTFDTDIGAFRAFIASSPGYHRLEDTYHPDEYYKAAFVDGLEAETGILNHSGQFDVNFERLPERWLKSGETWTDPIMPAGNVAQLVNGGGEVNTDYLMTPRVTASVAYEFSLIAVPLPGHSLSELADLADGTYYAFYAYITNTTSGAAAYARMTDTIKPALVSDGRWTINLNANDEIYMQFYNLAGFDWQIEYGGDAYTIGGAVTVINQTLYPAKPLVKVAMLPVTASRVGIAYRSVFTINGTTVFVDKDCPTMTAFFDCDLGDFYGLENGDAVNLNQYLSMEDSDGNVVHEYPQFTADEAEVSFYSDAWLSFVGPSVVTVQPRWWTL